MINSNDGNIVIKVNKKRVTDSLISMKYMKEGDYGYLVLVGYAPLPVCGHGDMLEICIKQDSGDYKVIARSSNCNVPELTYFKAEVDELVVFTYTYTIDYLFNPAKGYE